jgi:hypothetical protein
LHLPLSQAQGLTGKRKTATFLAPPPTPKASRKKQKKTGSYTSGLGAEFLDFHPEEVARQMCLVEHEHFGQINPWEFFGLGWTKKDARTRSPNVLKFIDHFNQVSNWVTNEILQIADNKKRALTLCHFIEIAKVLDGVRRGMVFFVFLFFPVFLLRNVLN